MQPTLALFDVDGTLVPAPSCERRFMRHLLAEGVLGPRQLASAAWFLTRYAPRFGRHVSRKNKAYLAGLERAAIEEIADRFVAEFIIPQLFEPALQRLRMHQKRGDTIALLTGAPDFIARPLASELGVEHVQPTICDEVDGRFTSRPPRVHPLGKEKASLGRDLCTSLGFAIQGATAYADSIFDLPLLEAVGTPIAINPDPALGSVARSSGWEVLAGLEVKGIPETSMPPQ